MTQRGRRRNRKRRKRGRRNKEREEKFKSRIDRSFVVASAMYSIFIGSLSLFLSALADSIKFNNVNFGGLDWLWLPILGVAFLSFLVFSAYGRALFKILVPRPRRGTEDEKFEQFFWLLLLATSLFGTSIFATDISDWSHFGTDITPVGWAGFGIGTYYLIRVAEFVIVDKIRQRRANQSRKQR